MSKLPAERKFLDLSDYGRTPAKWIANGLKETKVTPVQVTTWFVIAGLGAILAIFYELYFLAGILLVLKSILDAADGELSRVKETPSYIGRYYDSIADIILNFLFLFIIGYKTHIGIPYVLVAFLVIQLQGTLYNYYYVILRNKYDGDTTSRVFETEPPKAFPGEKQGVVNRMFHVYNALYIGFDKTIYYADPGAAREANLPPWFMTIISVFGLGFQLLIMAIMLNLGLIAYIIPFFIFSGLLIPVAILLRRGFL